MFVRHGTRANMGNMLYRLRVSKSNNIYIWLFGVALVFVTMAKFNTPEVDNDVSNYKTEFDGVSPVDLTAQLKSVHGSYACCLKLLSSTKAQLGELWKANPDNKGIACNILYRGVEVQIGRVDGDQIMLGSQDEVCLQIPKEHEYLLFRDRKYETFMRTLDKDISTYEDKMEEAYGWTKHIYTPGTSSQDRRHRLASFLQSAFELEKPLPFVEVGSAAGFTGALATAFAHIVQLPRQMKIYMISPVERGMGNYRQAFFDVIEKHGMKDRVQWVNGTQLEVPWMFGPVRSIFEDTYHSAESVIPTIVLAWRYLVEGGLFAFHDVRCPLPYPGLMWAFDNLRNSPGWQEIVYPFKENPDCVCIGDIPHFQEGCNVMRTLRRRVTQPPLGLRIVVQGYPEGATNKDPGANTKYQELATFKAYQDFFERP
jgi:hypothetical protein